MKLSELLNNYKPVYPNDHNWEATLACLLSDPIEKAKVDYLMNVLKSGRAFKKPILLGAAEFDEGTEVLAVLNGTHRVCAHMLSNIEEVYVVKNSDVIEKENDFYLNTEVFFENQLSDNEIDMLFDALLSFPLTQDIWMEANLSSISNQTLHLLWENDPEDDSVQLLINDEVSRIIKKYFPVIQFSIKTTVEKF